MTLEDYLEELTLQHKRPNTIKNIKTVLTKLDNYKKLDHCDESDIKDYIKKYNENFKEKYKKEPQFGNLNTIYGIIKQYYEKQGKPELVKWIKIKNHLKKLNPNDLLEKSEIQDMLRVCDNTRNKCLLAVVYEAGMRIGEALSIKKDDVKMGEGECKIRIPDNHEGNDINSKTGSRLLILIESVPYIEKYLNVHNGDDRLFPIKKTRADDIIKEMAMKAGIKKRVYWHLLRHTRATEMAKLGMQETSMKKRFGWVGSSKMIDRYTSLTDDDADDAYKSALGLGVKKKDVVINPIAKRCSKCGKLIEAGSYCAQCDEIERLNTRILKQDLQNEFLTNDLSQIKSLLLEIMDEQERSAFGGDSTMDGLYKRNPEILKAVFEIDKEEYQKRKDEYFKLIYGMSRKESEILDEQRTKKFLEENSIEEILKEIYDEEETK